MSDNGTVPTDKMKWALDSAISLSIARGMPGVAEGLTCAKVQLQQLREELEQVKRELERMKEEMEEREFIIKRKFKIKQEAVDEAMTENQQLREELERIRKSGLSWMDSWRDAQVEIQSLRSELAEKDNVNVEVRKGLKGIADAVGVAIGYGERIDNGLLMDELVRLHSILAQVAKEGDGH